MGFNCCCTLKNNKLELDKSYQINAPVDYQENIDKILDFWFRVENDDDSF
jgi:hypothetical protein